MAKKTYRIFSNTNDVNTSKLMDRADIDEKYKWNLKDIYKSEDDWANDFEWLRNSIPKYKTYEGKLLTSAKIFKECLLFDDQVGIKFGQLYLYAMLNRDLNLAETKYQALYQRTILLSSQLDAAASFIKPEILAAPEEKIWEYCKQEEELKVYEHLFKNILRTKTHTLSSDKEEILARVSPALNVSSDAFGLLTNADIQFPKVKDENGKLIEVTHGRYGAVMYSLDREYRKRFYKSYYKPYMRFQNTLASLFDGNIKASVFNAKVRNYESTRNAALDNNNIPLSVYDNLVNTVENNLEPLNRWCSLKKKVMGVKSFHSYDIYVTLFPSVEKKYSYEESLDILYSALSPLGEEYILNLKLALNNRWIDVYETKGKRSGAYSSGTTFGVHPYVLLNWNDQLNDVFTLAHEMGHNMHSYYTGKNQPFPYAGYSIFIAEVTSTLNEALLLDYLIEQSKSKEEKLFLIEKHISNIVGTFYRQTLFAKFEQTVHEKAERNEALTPDYLNELYGTLHKKFWGKDMILDKEESFTWARVPHFYYNFYVYQYATSYAASEILADVIKLEGKPAVDRYLNFLKAGNSDYPINVLKQAGVDMTSPQPILGITKKFNFLLDKMEELL